MEALQRTRRGKPCPICGEANMKCSYNSKVALCVNVTSDRPCGGKVFIPTWIHPIGKDCKVDYVPVEKKQGFEIASRERRDRCYRAFLDSLSISSKHVGHLVQSGFDPRIIARNKYKTIPDFRDRWKYAKKLTDAGFSLEGIPGFFKAEARGRSFWTFMAHEGMFIPVRDIDGYIIRLRIRLDRPEIKPNGKKKNKYRWFSSAELNMGTGSGTSCHVAMGSSDVIWITEGEKKADVGNFKTGKTFVSVPGIYEWYKALGIIRVLAPQKVVVAFDSDKAMNPDVAKYEAMLIKGLKMFPEIEVFKTEWDLSLAKGIDDLLISGNKPKIYVA